MAISKRTMKDGSVRYQVEMVQTDPVTGKRRRKSIGRFFPKKLAEKKEREAQQEIDAGTFAWEPVAHASCLAALYRQRRHRALVQSASILSMGFTVCRESTYRL